MLFLKMAMRTHRPATLLRLSFGFAEQFPVQMRGCTQGLSLAQRVFALLLSPRPALLQFQERARPIPRQTKPREARDLASCVARWTNRKTNSQTDSWVPAENVNLSDLIIAALGGFAAVKKQIGRRCTRKDFQAGGRVR